MTDSKYIGKLDSQDKRWYDYVIRWKGSDSNALDFLLKYLDCSRIYEDGSRPIMTNYYSYRTDISGYLYILQNIENCNPTLAEEYKNKLIKLHEENLDFEKLNPPIVYKSKQRTSSRSDRRIAEIENIFTGEKSKIDVGSGKIIKPKENAATRKAKALSDKSVNFAFGNFKISK